MLQVGAAVVNGMLQVEQQGSMEVLQAEQRLSVVVLQ
jgi:hypothetical protein